MVELLHASTAPLGARAANALPFHTPSFPIHRLASFPIHPGTWASWWRDPRPSSTCARASPCCASTWRSRWVNLHSIYVDDTFNAHEIMFGTPFAQGRRRAACIHRGAGGTLARWFWAPFCGPGFTCMPARAAGGRACHALPPARTTRRLFSAADAPPGRLRRAADGRRRAERQES